MARNKTWSVRRIQDDEHPGHTVRVGEYVPGGTLHVFLWRDGKQQSRSLKVTRADLGSTSREQEREARIRGRQFIAALVAHDEGSSMPAPVGSALTLRPLAQKYEDDGFAGRTPSYKRDALASVRRVAKYLGDVAVSDLTPNAVQKYMEHRKAEGHAPAGRGDLVALSIAINWAIGEKMLKENPLADKKARAKMKLNSKPARPVADKARYRALKAKAGALPPDFGVLLDLAWHTGHRIGAILGLKWCDVSFKKTEDAPNGSITWYAGAQGDKKKHEHVLPMHPAASKSLTAWKKASGIIGASAAWTFPAPQDPRAALQRHVAKKWLRRAETLAEVGHLKHGGFHMFRRGWATARKHLPLHDVAAGGGWDDTESLTKCYQHADPATTKMVVLKVV